MHSRLPHSLACHVEACHHAVNASPLIDGLQVQIVKDVVLDRSWDYLTGKQLDCFTCLATSSDDILDKPAPFSLINGNGSSADGGVPAASAMLQGEAAKPDLGDADNAELGTSYIADQSTAKCSFNSLMSDESS